MSEKNILRLLVIAFWLNFIAYVFSSVYFEFTLPQPLQLYIFEQDTQQISIYELVSALLLLIATLVSSIGVFLCKSWGRTLWLVTFIAGYLLPPYFEPWIFNAAESYFYEFMVLIEGAILAMMYLGSAKALFVHNDNTLAPDKS